MNLTLTLTSQAANAYAMAYHTAHGTIPILKDEVHTVASDSEFNEDIQTHIRSVGLEELAGSYASRYIELNREVLLLDEDAQNRTVDSTPAGFTPLAAGGGALILMEDTVQVRSTPFPSPTPTPYTPIVNTDCRTLL